VSLLVLALEFWLGFGLLFGLVFVFTGIGRVHEGARAAGVGARLILVPGCAIFWPWLLYLWLRRRTPPVECTNHRCAVPGGDS
jgi:hypothetical protein